MFTCNYSFNHNKCPNYEVRAGNGIYCGCTNPKRNNYYFKEFEKIRFFDTPYLYNGDYYEIETEIPLWCPLFC